jgi:prepilin-type N-terminal cleavage/methylation domain-containing protein
MRREGVLSVKRTARAYSLIEVMIGLFILSLVLLACIAALPQMRELSYRSDAVRMGFTHLNAEIEGFRTQTFDQMSTELDSASGSSTNQDLLNSLLGRESAGVGSKVTHTASMVEQNDITYQVDSFLQYLDSDKTVIKATVVVRWDFRGKTENISSHAVFTENGLSDKKFSLAN